MKIILEDNGDLTAKKGPPKGARASQATSRRTSRNSGFKRKKETGSVDALVDSGADDSFEMQGFDSIPESPVVPEPTPDDMGLSYTGFADTKPIDMDALQGMTGDVMESQPLADPTPFQPPDTDFPPLEVAPGFQGQPHAEEPKEESSGPVARKSLNLGDIAKGAKKESTNDLEPEDEPEEEPATKASRFVREPQTKKGRGKGLSLGGSSKSKGPAKPKGPSKSKLDKPAKPSKFAMDKKARPLVEDEDGEVDIQPKGKKAKSKKPSDPMTVMIPESPLSQLVTLIEVVVAGGLVFFGASQVGNILINQIVSGMLGG